MDEEDKETKPQLGSLIETTPTSSSKPTAPVPSSTHSQSSVWQNYIQAYYGSAAAASHPYFTLNTSANPYPSTSQLIEKQWFPQFYRARRPHNGLYATPNMATFGISSKEEKIHDGNNTIFLHVNGVRNERERSLDRQNDVSGISPSIPRLPLPTTTASRRKGSSVETEGQNRILSATKKWKRDHAVVDGQAQLQSVAPKNIPSRFHGMNTDLALLDLGQKISEINPSLGINLKPLTNSRAILTKEEEEFRKEKRKIANRESAKRSRFRKQQECEKLQKAVENLRAECSILAEELRRVSEECAMVIKENNSIMDELEKAYGAEAIRDLMALQPGCMNGQSNGDAEQRTPKTN